MFQPLTEMLHFGQKCDKDGLRTIYEKGSGGGATDSTLYSFFESRAATFMRSLPSQGRLVAFSRSQSGYPGFSPESHKVYDRYPAK